AVAPTRLNAGAPSRRQRKLLKRQGVFVDQVAFTPPIAAFRLHGTPWRTPAAHRCPLVATVVSVRSRGWGGLRVGWRSPSVSSRPGGGSSSAACPRGSG